MLIKPRINLEKINLFPKVLNCSIIKNQLVIIIQKYKIIQIILIIKNKKILTLVINYKKIL